MTAEQLALACKQDFEERFKKVAVKMAQSLIQDIEKCKARLEKVLADHELFVKQVDDGSLYESFVKGNLGYMEHQ